MVGWSWAQNPVSNSLSMTLVEWEDETQEEVHRSEYVLADCSMAPHDFAVTESYYVFVVNQLEIDLAPYMLGFKGPAQCLSCTGDGVVVHLVPRPGGRAQGTDPIVIKTQDPWFVIHHATAHEEWTEGGELAKITVYSTGWDKVSEGPFLSDWGGAVPLYDKIPATFLFKLEIDVGSGTVERSKCSGHCEHAHVHPAWEARAACRYVYACSGNTFGFSSPPTAWLRYDTRSGEEALWQGADTSLLFYFSLSLFLSFSPFLFLTLFLALGLSFARWQGAVTSLSLARSLSLWLSLSLSLSRAYARALSLALSLSQGEATSLSLLLSHSHTQSLAGCVCVCARAPARLSACKPVTVSSSFSTAPRVRGRARGDSEGWGRELRRRSRRLAGGHDILCRTRPVVPCYFGRGQDRGGPGLPDLVPGSDAQRPAWLLFPATLLPRLRRTCALAETGVLR